MRFGLFSIVTLLTLFFFIVINYSEISPEKIDQIFEGVDANVMDKFEGGSDANLSNFARYTAKGIVYELHGTYYLASWVNTFLPSWLLENLDVVLILGIFALVSPAIFYGSLLVIMVCMMVYEKVQERKKR